jgi:hypothetical protein
MSIKAKRYGTKTSRQQRARFESALIEIEDFYKKPLTPKRFAPSEKNRDKLWDLDCQQSRSRIISWIIKYGDAPIPLTDSENTEELDFIIAKRHEIWGNDTLFFLTASTLEDVISAIDWSLDTSSLEILVDFAKLVDNLSCDLIPSEWQYFLDEGKLYCLYEKETKRLTTKRDPRLQVYSFDVLDISTEEVKNKINQVPLMGIELEFTEPEGMSLSSYLSVLTMGAFKADSTTDVEFVSVPLEYQELVENLKRRQPSFNIMLSANGRETNGMHVHVSRQDISLGQQARIQYLINARKNRSWWSKVADRDVENNNYCHFSKLTRNLIRAVKNTDFGVLNSSDFPYERTVAVNFRKTETIEFRLFKSPNNLEKVLENLRIFQAILDYTKEGGYTLPGFIEFLSSRN